MKSITIPAALIRAAVANQARNDVRYSLNGILLASNGDVVGTDGHTVFRGRSDTAPSEDIIVQIDGKIPLRAESVIFDFDNPATGGLARTDCGKIFRFEVIDGKYPDYTRVIPTLPRTSHDTGFGLDPALIARAAATFGKNAKMAVYPGGSLDVVLCQYAGSNTALEGSIFGVMPVRLDAFNFEPVTA